MKPIPNDYDAKRMFGAAVYDRLMKLKNQRRMKPDDLLTDKEQARLRFHRHRLASDIAQQRESPRD